MPQGKIPRLLYRALGAVTLLGGCHSDPPDVLGLSDKLEWKSDEAIVLCQGESFPVPVVKYGVDSSTNTWIPVSEDTGSLLIRMQDPRIVKAQGHISISGVDTGATLISAIDTADHTSTPWRKVTVRSCP
ncbi:MAG TPA: hypothetical protein VJ385_22010 [Fibrobacteria bacterium]|nr:hypothetical protein [Fibrobacteria bacterium]